MNCRRGPLFRGEIALFHDPFVRLGSTFDFIFELAISLGQLRYYLIRPARGITIEDGGLQNYATSDLESMLGLMRRGQRRD